MNFKKLLPKSQFSKNVLTLMTGSTIAQVIPVLFSIVLSRMYTSEDFGVFAFVSSIIFIIGGISSLTYETTIVLPKEQEKANNLTLLSIVITILFFLLLSLLIFFFPGFFLHISKNTSTKEWLFLIPFGVFLHSLYQISNYVVNRKEKYKKLAQSRVLQSIVTGIASVTIGYFNFKYWGLLIGLLLGLLMGILFLSKDIYNILPNKVNKFFLIKLKKVAYEYKYFPKFSAFSTLFNSFSNVGLPLIITIFYGTIISGGYFFAAKVIRLPLNFIFSSFSQVYRQKAAILYFENKEELLRLTQKTQIRLALFMIPLLLLASIFSPILFSVVFGEEWGLSGEYVKYFAVFIFFNGLYSPISAIGDILREQKFLLFFNISLSLSQIIILYYFSSLYSFKIAILFTSLVGSLHFVFIDFYMKNKLRKILDNEKISS